MYSESKKIVLIEEILKVKNDSILLEIEKMLFSANNHPEKKTSIYDFAGIISKSEAEEMKKAIAEACEIIDDNDWK